MRCLYMPPHLIWSSTRRSFAHSRLQRKIVTSLAGACACERLAPKWRRGDNVMMNVQISSASLSEIQHFYPTRMPSRVRLHTHIKVGEVVVFGECVGGKNRTQNKTRTRKFYECFWQFNSTFWQVLHNQHHQETQSNNMSTQFNHFMNEMTMLLRWNVSRHCVLSLKCAWLESM